MEIIGALFIMNLSNIARTLTKPKKLTIAVLSRVGNLVCKIRYREKKIKYGTQNADKTFYVIGFDCGWCGIMRIIVQVLGHLEYAKKHNYIPVINLKNHYTQYSDKKDTERKNAWEYFLKQPSQYSIEDTINAKNIILSRNMPYLPANAEFTYIDLLDKKKTICFQKLFTESIKFNDYVQNNIEKQHKLIIKDKKNILGVLCRGTDFTAKHPPLHPIQPTTEQVIKKAKEVMEKHACDYLFLATEDAEIHTMFQQEFGDKLLSIQQKRYTAKDFENANSISQKDDDKIHLALNYLSALNILANCKCFIGGLAGGTQGVYLMNKNGFEYEYLWDIGVYPQSLKHEFLKFCHIIAGKPNCLTELYY